MKFILCAVSVIFLLWCQESSALAQCPSTISPTLVVFGNGITTTQDDAKKSLIRLQDELKANLSPLESSNLFFDLAYNQTYGTMSDLYESLKQKMGTDNVVISFWRWMGGLEVVPTVVRDEIKRIVTQFDYSTQVGTTDLDIHLALYRSSTNDGKKVIVVSHSQGNFFANAAYEILYGGTDPVYEDSFSIVSVANPASFVGGNGPYTTASEDLVIAAITATTLPGFLPPLLANATNVGSTAIVSDWARHDFVMEYMVAGSNTAPLIIQNVVSAMPFVCIPIM